jgi:hypothetical protein
MAALLTEEDWTVLVQRIKLKKCTPFLGAGACHGVLPLGGEIAQEWAKEHGYPLEDSSDLPKVSQFLAVKLDPMIPKDLIVEKFTKLFEAGKSPDFTDPLEPHRVLASLSLPVYITTNYDDFLARALKNQLRDVESELCRWNKAIEQVDSIFDKEPGYSPTVARPLVFHLHGRIPTAESLVLTEDDFLDFLVNISNAQQLLPSPIEKALKSTSLLFIGYRIGDLNLRVLLQGFRRVLEKAVKYTHVAVMLPPASAKESSQDEVQAYLTKYYKDIDVRVYWGTVRGFLSELKARLG